MMNDIRPDKSGSVTTPGGYRACGIRCGLKEKGKDLALIVSDSPASAAALFTTNKLPAPCIEISRRIISDGRARALVINSGNANACTGEQGKKNVLVMIERTAEGLVLDKDQILAANTGIIGVPLPMDILLHGISIACTSLSPQGGIDAAQAIMTTDTIPKHGAVEFDVHGKRCRIGAIAKGSGMINPNMATMICILTTDIAIQSDLLRKALIEASDTTLNALTVDGEMSTNDAVFLFANGTCGNEKILSVNKDYRSFVDALTILTRQITLDLARDGEGATKLVTIRVTDAVSADEAKIAAKAIANSMLVKTAIFGQDPNWGRIVQSVGACDVSMNADRLNILFDDVVVLQKGKASDFAADRVRKILKQGQLLITVSLGVGEKEATVYTCDLTHDYITINADYHT